MENALSWWKLDETTGTVVVDTQGNNNGTNNGVTINQTSEFGKCYSFDGTDDYINVPQASDLNFGTGSFSLCAWVKHSSASGEKIILRNDNESGNPRRFYTLAFSSGFIYFDVYDSGTDIQSVSPSSGYDNGQWHFVVGVRNGDNVLLYIDGGLVKTATGALNVNVTVSGGFLVIGAYQGLEGGWLNGSIDEVRIYNRALSQAEISQLYNQNCVDFAITMASGLHGSASQSPNSRHYYNDSVTLTATPEVTSDHLSFKQWQDANSDNPRVVTVVGDITYTATFKWRHAYLQTFETLANYGNIQTFRNSTDYNNQINPSLPDSKSKNQTWGEIE